MSSQLNQRVITVFFKLDCCPYENEWEIRNSNNSSEVVASRDYASTRAYTTKIDTVYLNEGDNYTLTIYDAGGDGLHNGYYEVFEGSRDSMLAQGSENFGGVVEHSLQPERLYEVKSGDVQGGKGNQLNMQSTATSMLIICILSIIIFIGYTMIQTRQKGMGVKAIRRDVINNHLNDRPPDDYDIPMLIQVKPFQ